MRSKYFTLLTLALLLVGAKVWAQCPTLEKFNQGNGNPGSCAGVSGTPIPPSFIGTGYDVVPPGTKTAELNASWPTSPNPLPAVKNIYFNGAPTAHESGPPTIPVLQGGKYKSQYCFYHPTGAAIPSFKTISIVYYDPQPDTLLRVCSYDPGGNEIPPPVITRQPTDQVGCLGYKSIFSVAAIPGQVSDTNLFYQWMKDGVDIPGATDSFLVITVTAADTGTDRYQVRIIADPSLAIMLSVEVSLTLNKQAVWTGATSTNWLTASNWLPMIVPDSTMHVYVANKTNKPLISGPDTGRCKCLTLDTGWVNLIGNGRLEIAGRIQLFAVARYINGLDGSVVLNGTELAQLIPDSTFLQNTVDRLTFANTLGVVNVDTLDITGRLTPIQGIFTTAGLVTLKSKPTGTARVDQGGSSGGYIVGQVTVERYVPVVPGGYRAWRYLSVLTTGPQTIKEAWQENGSGLASNPWPGYGTFITCNSNFNTSAGFDAIMPNMSIQAFDEGTQSFTSTPVTNTNVKTLSSERAYFLYVRGDRTVLPAPIYDLGNSTTLRSKGLLRQGDQSATGIPSNQFAALGNPFASHIDFSAISLLDRINVGNKFWLWDPRRSGSFGVGAWVLFDFANLFLPQTAGGSYPNVPNTLIPLGMGFLVQGGIGGGTLSIRENVKFGSNSNNGFKGTTNADRFQIALDYVKDAKTVIPADGVCAVFGDYSNDINLDDANKIVNTGENIAIRHSGKELTLDARPAIKQNDTVNLKIWKLVKTYNYRITINPIVQTLGVKATFVDKYLQTTMDLDMSKPTTIDFKINDDSASFGLDRFYVALGVDPSTQIKDLPTAEVSVYPNPTDAQNINLNIRTASSGEYSFKIIDAMGREVHNETYDHAGQSLVKTLAVHGRLVPGNYFIAISKDGQELATEKLIINK